MENETTLNSFERLMELGTPLVKLGKKYYTNGHVTTLTQNPSNEWQARVKGIEDYYVNVKLSTSNEVYKIEKSTCNCSFNGPHCLHKVAAYYAIYNNLFPNELSEIAVSEITLSELEDDKTVQDAYWEIHKEYLKFYVSSSNKVITMILNELRKSLTKAYHIAKNNPILAVRLLIVSYYDLIETKGYIKDFKNWDKLENRWDHFYGGVQEKTLKIISEIKDEETARCVTDLVLNETLELQCSPEKFLEDHPYISLQYSEEQRDLYFRILIELSSLAQSYDQIKQLLNEPRLLLSYEKERFMNKLLLKQGNDEINPTNKSTHINNLVTPVQQMY